jgi:hypothetical protein
LTRPNFESVFKLTVVLCLWSTSGLAANISLSSVDDDPAHALVAVEGGFEAGDHIKFRTQVGRLTNALVVFNSGGGNLLAGIEIGKTIRLKSFATAVLNGWGCASACAFAWLGGSPRFMERGAQIGFHAAYIESEGRPSESGVGNALVGSYLTQIGLSESAVVYITQAAPTKMTWLTFADAKRIGIEVVPWEFEKDATKPTPPANQGGPYVPAPTPNKAYWECADSAVKPTFWVHNGSIMCLTANGDSRSFYYAKPRAGMIEAGAKPGDLLFSGKAVGMQYVGRAYVFAGQCGKFAYEVRGNILNNYRQVELQGQAPQVDGNCNIIGQVKDTLGFSLMDE